MLNSVQLVAFQQRFVCVFLFKRPNEAAVIALHQFFILFFFCFKMTQKFRDQLNLRFKTFSQLLSVAKNYSFLRGRGCDFSSVCCYT